MVLAESPHPAETIEHHISDEMQVKIDTLHASGVELLLQEYLPQIHASEASKTNRVVDVSVMKRPWLKVDQTAALGVVVTYSGEDSPIEAVSRVRVEALDTKHLVVAYMDQSSPKSREHRWVSLAEHAQTRDIPNVEDFLSVPVDTDTPEQNTSHHELLRFQIEHAILFAYDAQKKIQPQEVDIVTFS